MRSGAPRKWARADGSESRSIPRRSSTRSRACSILRSADRAYGLRLRADLAPVLRGESLEVEVDRAEGVEDAGVAGAELAAQARNRRMEIVARVEPGGG